ncbi:MAG: thioredoxin domain-containing protein [Thermodesulfovibrionales bacterium]
MNRLATQKSPYLLQHADNPVDWMPWGASAFTEAKTRDVPIFLSIGYSTCHWCHVMERESFADTEVAQLLNSNFVCVKVDREERPDIDNLYMDFCHILTGSGGWPLTIIMTPDQMPFYSATYLPKTGRYNIIGLIELIQKVSSLWKNERDLVKSIALRVTRHLEDATNNLTSVSYQLDYKALCDDAFNSLKSIYDTSNGGFGRAPKFPMPVYLLFLIDYYKATGQQDALKMLKTTLLSMRNGGIYDHIGFGFHRYSTDAEWKIPHFEKMLYDQALLLQVYSKAYDTTGQDIFKHTAKEIVTYVFRELTSKDCIFYSAQDADTEGVEGLYYLWGIDELKALLSTDEYEIIARLYHLKEDGNFEDTAKNIIYMKHLTSETSLADERLQGIINKLYNHRIKRNRPFLDKKILTDWNALMISSLINAGMIFENNSIIDRAKMATDYIIQHLYDSASGLSHYSIEEYRSGLGFLDDYAYFINALLALYSAKGDKSYLETATEITEYVIHHFSDAKNGGFYFTDGTKEKLLIRQKVITDSVMPSGNASMMGNLLYLNKITGKERYKDLALSIPTSSSSTLKASPLSSCTILSNAIRFGFI